MMDFTIEYEDVGDQTFPDVDNVDFLQVVFPDATVVETRPDWIRRTTGRTALEIVERYVALGVLEVWWPPPIHLNANSQTKRALFFVTPEGVGQVVEDFHADHVVSAEVRAHLWPEWAHA